MHIFIALETLFNNTMTSTPIYSGWSQKEDLLQRGIITQAESRKMSKPYKGKVTPMMYLTYCIHEKMHSSCCVLNRFSLGYTFKIGLV